MISALLVGVYTALAQVTKVFLYCSIVFLEDVAQDLGDLFIFFYPRMRRCHFIEGYRRTYHCITNKFYAMSMIKYDLEFLYVWTSSIFGHYILLLVVVQPKRSNSWES